MQGTKVEYRDGACEYVFMRYNELAENLREVIVDLPILVLPTKALDWRDTGVSMAGISMVLGLIAMLLGMSLGMVLVFAWLGNSMQS